MKTLVTVACYRDFHQILLQAESISLFLEPCTHYIIVNEEKIDLDFWYRWLSPYYKNHELKIIPKIEYDYDTVRNMFYKSENSLGEITLGWRTQQLQKLLIATLIDEDYLILDAKTLFLKHCGLHDWDNAFGSSHDLYPVSEIFDNTNYFYSKFFNKELLKSVPFGYTPVKIILDPLKQYLENPQNRKNLHVKLFLPEVVLINGHISPGSEFLFYCYIASDYLKDQHTRFSPTTNLLVDDTPNEQIEIMLLNQPVTWNIHRKFLNKCSPQVLDTINTHLSSIGFKNKLYPYPDSFDVFF